MPRRAKQKGFQELDPNQTITDLFTKEEEDDDNNRLFANNTKRIVFTTRRNNEDARAFVDAFQQMGWSARIQENQTGIEDFCFLWHAKRDLVGTSRSTFFLWAGLLGNAARVRCYSMNTTETRTTLVGDNIFWGHQFKRKELKDRFRFSTITPRNVTVSL